jgi:hypothetical protein
MRWHIRCLLVLVLSWISPAIAQPPVGPLTPVAMDPVLGQICAGIPGLGAAPCNVVQTHLQVQARAQQILPQLQYLGPGPFGPMCAGPLGPGGCPQVAQWIAINELAQQQFQLPVLGQAPGVGPICAGPLGPGPCEAVKRYLMQAANVIPTPLDFQQIRLAPAQGAASSVPMCEGGPFGTMPCDLVGQMSLDQIGRAPVPQTFALPNNVSQGRPEARARACAQQVGLNVEAFAVCMGEQIVLPPNEHAVLECAMKSPSAEAFGRCASQHLGMKISDDQRILADCALRSKGNAQQLASCSAGRFAAGALGKKERAILDCAASANGDSEDFVRCSAPHFMGRQEKAVLDCAVSSASVDAFAACAMPNAAVKMSNDQRIVARCGLQSKGDTSAFVACAGSGFAVNNLGPREQAVVSCAGSANGDGGKFAGCAAEALLGGQMSREQQVALRCAAESGGDPQAALGCAGANMFNLQMSPEQQIAVQCVVASGGTPAPAAGCMASRLTIRELTKCMTDGVGGKGCFGDSNDLVGKNGWVRKTMGQIAGGPNSLINNPDQIWGGDNSFVRNPGQIFGGDNSFVRNPGQIFGGSNSVFNKPSQLIPKPKISFGGGKRKCKPFCL